MPDCGSAGRKSRMDQRIIHQRPYLRLRGFDRVAAHRLQRLTWLLIFPPHFGQRRFFSCSVNFVRGRLFMGTGGSKARWAMGNGLV